VGGTKLSRRYLGFHRFAALNAIWQGRSMQCDLVLTPDGYELCVFPLAARSKLSCTFRDCCEFFALAQQSQEAPSRDGFREWLFSHIENLPGYSTESTGA